MSVAVASYAFNRPERVAVPTRERVLATALALGYRGPDATARALRLGRPGALTLAGAGSLTDLLADGAALEVARGLARTCDRLGLGLTFEDSRGGSAVVFRAVPDPRRGVAVAVDPPGETATPTVAAQLARGTAAAASHLASLGHRRLAVVAWPGCGARLEGARLGWTAREPIRVIMAPGPARLDGEPSGRAALALSPRPTAVLALSDPLAVEVLDAAVNLGLRVPDDLSVVGVDDLPGSSALGLTSVAVPYRPMGERAGEALWALLGGTSPPAATALPTALVVRTTAGRAPLSGTRP